MVSKKSAKKKTTKKTSAKKSEKSNIVAVAHRLIPRSYNRKLQRWIKSHKRTIFLSTGLVVGLYAAYLDWKLGASRKTSEAMTKIIGAQKKARIQTKRIAKQATRLDQAAERFQSNQIFFGTRLDMENARIEDAEKALSDSGFKEWLKKQGYTNIRKVKK